MATCCCGTSSDGKSHKRWITSARLSVWSFRPTESLLHQYDGTVRLWNLASGREVHAFEADGAAAALAFSPNGKTILVGNEYGEIFVWNLETKKRTATFAVEPSKYEYAENYVLAIHVLKDNQTAITAEYGGKIRGWDLKRGKQINVVAACRKQNGWKQAICSMAVFPDEKFVLCGEIDGTMEIIKAAPADKLSGLPRGHVDCHNQ